MPKIRRSTCFVAITLFIQHFTEGTLLCTIFLRQISPSLWGNAPTYVCFNQMGRMEGFNKQISISLTNGPMAFSTAYKLTVIGVIGGGMGAITRW